MLYQPQRLKNDHLGQPLRHAIPRYFEATVDNKPLGDQVDQHWIENDFIPTVQKRGAAIIEARGLSSAASAANAAIDHIHDWVAGTEGDDWVSMGVVSDGSYGTPKGLIYGFPCRCKNGDYEIVQNLKWSDFSKKRIEAVTQELLEERAAVEHLF